MTNTHTLHLLGVAFAALATTALPHTAPAQEAGDSTAPTLEPPTTDTGRDPVPSASPKPSAGQEQAPIYEKGGLAGLGLVAGGKLGVGFSSLFSDLGTSFVGELELGYLLPFLDRSIQAFASGQYAAPTAEGTISDDRLAGDASYSLTQRYAIVTLGGLYRLALPTPLIRPYGGLGLRVYMMRTEIDGEVDGEAFRENQETATAAGFYGAVGGELYAGPGAVLLELQFGYGGADGFVLRDTNVASFNVVAGYRVFL